MAALLSTELDSGRGQGSLVPAQTPVATGDSVPGLGFTLLHVTNTGAGAVNFTVKGEPDGSDRAVDTTFSIPAGSDIVLGPFKFPVGWATPSGKINIIAGTPADTVVRVMEVNKK